MSVNVRTYPYTRQDQYNDYILSRRWAYKRQITLFLAGKRPEWWPGGPRPAVCQVHRLGKGYGECRSTRLIQVHHLTYARMFHERIRDRIALCKRHHMAEHGKDAPVF